MIDFSLQHILKDSPYDITLSEAGFIFQTDNGIHYHVSFDEEEIVLGGCKTYQFIFTGWIRPRFDVEPRVLMFGSYSKGNANADSDIDVAVIVPTYGDRKFEISKNLWHDVDQVSLLIEPVLMADDRQSPLYDDVMRTGVSV